MRLNLARSEKAQTGCLRDGTVVLLEEQMGACWSQNRRDGSENGLKCRMLFPTNRLQVTVIFLTGL